MTGHLRKLLGQTCLTINFVSVARTIENVGHSIMLCITQFCIPFFEVCPISCCTNDEALGLLFTHFCLNLIKPSISDAVLELVINHTIDVYEVHSYILLKQIRVSVVAYIFRKFSPHPN